MVLPRVINPIFVDYQGISECTDCQQTVPIAAGTGQARGCQAEDGTGPAQADFRDQLLKALATHAGGPRATLILIQDPDLIFEPNQLAGTVGQLVLACSTTGVLSDLAQRRLPNIDQRLALEMGIA